MITLLILTLGVFLGAAVIWVLDKKYIDTLVEQHEKDMVVAHKTNEQTRADVEFWKLKCETQYRDYENIVKEFQRQISQVQRENSRLSDTVSNYTDLYGWLKGRNF